MPMNEENKISVVINTWNAEQHLRKVLESVKGFDEVLVCDMESTDSRIWLQDCDFPQGGPHHRGAGP